MLQTRCLGAIPGCAIHKLRDLGPGLGLFSALVYLPHTWGKHRYLRHKMIMGTKWVTAYGSPSESSQHSVWGPTGWFFCIGVFLPHQTWGPWSNEYVVSTYCPCQPLTAPGVWRT